MEEILRDIDETDVYIDDVGVFTTSWERHVQVLKNEVAVPVHAVFPLPLGMEREDRCE